MSSLDIICLRDKLLAFVGSPLAGSGFSELPSECLHLLVSPVVHYAEADEGNEQERPDHS
jgi:hypothetical protein